MNKKSLRLISITFLGLAFFVSCSKGEAAVEDPDIADSLAGLNDWDIVIPSSKGKPGLGDNDDEPAGTPWKLPEGIRIVRRPHYPFNPSLDKLFGSVNTFYTDVSFVNDRMGGAPVQVEFPAGLVVVSTGEGRFQNGLSIERFILEVPPNRAGTDGRDTTTIYLGVACLNEGKALPWEENPNSPDVFHYPIGKDMHNKYVVTTDPNLLKLLKVFQDKPKLRLKRHWDPTLQYTDPNYVTPEWMEIYDEINARIWDITDGPGIQYGDYKKLLKSLEAYK